MREERSQKILVIDDELFMLKLLAHQLELLGFNSIYLCQEAQEAMSLLTTGEINTIDLVICDLQMPHMDGVEFLRHLSTIGYKGNLILVSGEEQRILQSAERLAKNYHLNIQGVLKKPVQPKQLEELLGKNTLSSPATTPRKVYPAEEVWRAIEQKELVNYYQPKIHMTSGEVMGVEALVRWMHPEDGLVFPDQFIPICEDQGFMNDLTPAVLHRALIDCQAYRRAGYPLHLAVNISMQNLDCIDFADTVLQTLERAEFPASSLTLEITESRLMINQSTALDIMTRLRLKGISLSIDDFGTGHSSLAQLRDLPFNELKIDRSFVQGAERVPALRAIVEASLTMANQLGMSTVAEGVEDEDDWCFLKTVGCDFAQGYFMAKPMPAEQLSTWLVQRERDMLTRKNLPH